MGSVELIVGRIGAAFTLSMHFRRPVDFVICYSFSCILVARIFHQCFFFINGVESVKQFDYFAVTIFNQAVHLSSSSDCMS